MNSTWQDPLDVGGKGGQRRRGLYVASVPQLPGCHTDGTSLDELMVEIREAIELCLEMEGNEPSNLEFVGIQRMTVAA